ncbi:MAG: hypothetical protein IPG45_38330 [Deltaproteobacteria bacterium]|jgi:capsular exopolysaccharide synthesis family protein|nr:hypothetical protein [Deltaproteobacteria bacterium]
MSEAKSFTLAVVKGQSVGQVLRSARKRISVGSAEDNDLVLEDPDVAPRHFLVLIEAGSWRIHTLSGDHPLSVDRQWSHPESGKRGALINAASAEILLYPGDLDPRIIELEVNRRATGDLPRRIDGFITNVDQKGASFPDDENVANEPTMAVTLDGDEIHYANAPTVASGRPPDDLREAARARLQGERAPSSDRRNRLIEPTITDPLENQPVRALGKNAPWEEKTVGLRREDIPVARAGAKGSAWERAKRPEVVPEILAEPESQMTRVPGAAKSVVSARPDFAAPAEAEVIELKPPPRPRGNAWGDRGEPKAEPKVEAKSAWGDRGEAKAETKNAWGDPRAGANAWGDPKNALVKREAEPRNAWGDGPKTPERRSAPRGSGQAEAPPRPRMDAPGTRIRLEALLAKEPDHALRILREPDGAFATAVRLLSTRIEELSRTLGYRTYVITSAEPLSGKTTIACNLAFALAEDTHRRVALIEANFRFPRLSEIMGLDERLGVLSVVEGRAQVPEAAVKVADRNLVMLPAGGRHPHPAEVLASPRFKQLVSELANTVDVAIIDAPSVTPSADVNLIMPLVDGALLVVADRSTQSGQLHKATAQIGESRVLGAIYNHLPKTTQRTLAAERSLRLKQK